MTGQKPREIAARVLHRRETRGDYVENLLEPELARLPTPDRGLCQELVYGVVRWQATLDWLIRQKTDERPQPARLQILLRLGLYQMLWLDRIPDHAAVNETVDLARGSGFGTRSGFVNALLRGCAREKEALLQRLESLKLTEPALGYSHPDWLVERWRQRWDAGDLRGLLEWNNTPPRTYARVNTLRTSAGKLLEQWRHEGVEYDFILRDWTGENLVFELIRHPSLDGLPSFREGGFYIQDPGTLMAVRMLDPRPGETILDFCAAPGGKTTFIAQLMENQGRIIAQDQRTPRLKLIRDNCDRLGVACVETSKYDGAIIPELNVHFDRILVDAPCSNTGVMRRRVDLRWRVNPGEIARLADVQIGLLNDAAGILKPGGVLVYSTCSLEPGENRDVVGRFLDSHPDYVLESERELLPFKDAVDGAYAAALRRQRQSVTAGDAGDGRVSRA